MTRRAFLAMAAGLAGVAAGAALVVRSVGAGRLVRNLRRLDRLEGLGRDAATRLRNHFAWLDVDPAAFDRYVADYQRFFGPIERFSIPRPDFYTRFLLSTNFFSTRTANTQSGPPLVRSAEASRYSYAAFYEPSESPCYNPIAQPPPSDAELAGERRGKTLVRLGNGITAMTMEDRPA